MSLAAEISLKIKHQTSSAPKQRNEPKWNKANIIDKIKTTEEKKVSKIKIDYSFWLSQAQMVLTPNCIFFFFILFFYLLIWTKS